MAAEITSTAQEIICIRVPCREGKERVWQAIDLLRQEQRRQQRGTATHLVHPHETKAIQQAGDS
jgi:hypothetical protein